MVLWNSKKTFGFADYTWSRKRLTYRIVVVECICFHFTADIPLNLSMSYIWSVAGILITREFTTFKRYPVRIRSDLFIAISGHPLPISRVCLFETQNCFCDCFEGPFWTTAYWNRTHFRVNLFIDAKNIFYQICRRMCGGQMGGGQKPKRCTSHLEVSRGTRNV